MKIKPDFPLKFFGKILHFFPDFISLGKIPRNFPEKSPLGKYSTFFPDF